MRFDTMAIHAGSPTGDPHGGVVPPIYQNTAFSKDNARAMEEVFAGRSFGYIYSRIANPTVACLEERITALEGGLGAVACSSGMAAIATAVTAIASGGDQIIACGSLFGGTYTLFTRSLPRFGISAGFFESCEAARIAGAITDRTKLIFMEAIGNPGLNVPDVRALADAAHGAGVALVVDGTATTPFLFRPREWGADIVIHSSTKYLSGHGNSLGGVIVDTGRFDWGGGRYADLAPYVERFGERAYLARIRKEFQRDFGSCLSPMNAFLTLAGLETLGLRMTRHCDNAMDLAAHLASHPKVRWVTYPGLPSHPQRDLASRQFGGRFGALLTIGLGSREKAFALLDSLKLARIVPNMGDTRTLVIHPASTIYSDFEREEREKLGVTDDMVRISVGIEDGRDIIDDFARGLEAV